jgi:CheY-like chemotaxis protein
MTAETIQRIFDQFFTTKFVGRGLGLAVVLGTARSHDGRVSVESVPDQGSTFRVLLPLTPPAIRMTSAVVTTPLASASGPALALVAEDEDALRRTTKRILVRMGYDVIMAVDGLDATEQFRQRASEIQLVILDLAMPRLDGWATLENIRSLRPDIPVILASGYDEAHVLNGRPLCHSLVYIHKPYSIDELRQAVTRLCSGASSGVSSGVEARPAAPCAEEPSPAHSAQTLECLRQ